MRGTARFLILLMVVVVFSPLATNDVEASPQQSSNKTVFTYKGIATDVSVVGEWDWDTPVQMVDQNGIWTGELELNEGIFCYKFIVDGQYLFDPMNPERSYCGDIENSLVRVRDHVRPQFSAELMNQSLIVTYHPGSSGSAFDGTPSALTGSVWDAQLQTWTYDLTGLDDGKHTFKIEGFDVDGNPAYDLLIPFWSGHSADFEWQDALIYMVMTDRFVNGNTSNDEPLTGAAQGADWQGGDFAGVTQMIESGYFDDLGVGALWLSPFNTAAEGTGKAADGVHDVSSFHGYWPTEPRGIEPKLGTEDELHALVQAAHDHNIRVMMDFVVNHVHEQHTYYQDNPEWFNAGCICGTANCDWTEHRLDCQFTSYMPDVNWKIRNASEQFIDDALWWLETYDLDGLRIDAVKHVEDLATRNLVAQVNERFETVGTDYYLKGETAMGWAGHSLPDNQEQYGTINAYMGPDGLDGQADFVLYHAVVDNVFVSGNENYQHLDYWTNRSQDQYVDGSVMVPYVGSHDVPRLTSRADTGTNDAFNQWSEDGLPGQPGDVSAYNAAMQAYGWLLTTPGAPLLYYGDEYGEYGGADPDNRHMYRNNSSWSSMENSLFENISELGKLRSTSLALQRGEYSTRLAMANLLVYNMTHDDQVMTIVLNRGAPTSVNGFEGNDIVRFGSTSIQNGILNVPAHSVTVIELNVDNEPLPVYGCTDSLATNFDSSATYDDGSCDYPVVPVLGCTDSTATNYDSEATEDDGTCIYPVEDVVGCMDSEALNFDPNATIDEGCEYVTDGSGLNETNQSQGQNNTNNQTDPTNETIDPVQNNETSVNQSNQQEMKTCNLCCGDTFEVPADEVCPVAACEPCEQSEGADSKSSSITLARSVLIGAIVVVALVLILSGRKGGGIESDLIDDEWTHHEN
ncbi:MAG: alpha-amylase family glycosyl hydrolase [Candidatus Thalassarchaeaceae archaeon]